MTRIINGENRYGVWAGCPQGQVEDSTRCIEEVWPANGWVSYQCCRKRGHGPEESYCKQHAKKYITKTTPMTKPLSPAAAAVLDAYSDGHESDRHAVAAALRAVADQVVPKCAQPSYGDDFSHGAWFARDDARDDLLRMSDEIETF